MNPGFYSTKNRNLNVDLKSAVLQGLAPDKGLFMPHEIKRLPPEFFAGTDKMSFSEIGIEVLKSILGDGLDENVLQDIVNDAFTFDAPLVQLGDSTWVQELFHGPTLAFKDFAARFMARLMGYFVKGSKRELWILVATSGDTGSAVANGFYKVPGIKVVILYPSGRVSGLQELQLTTLGENITTLEVKGTFDDCQHIVKTAFLDKDLISRYMMSSANSINIARLAPQAVYYVYGWSRRPDLKKPMVFSIPSGNFGNLTGGLLAKRIGLPVKQFIASTNVNDSVPRYLSSGGFEPRSTIHTISNAMDVGNPSNFERILDLYDGNHEAMRRDIVGYGFTDDQTRKAIRGLFKSHGYMCEPHGAVGWLGLNKYREEEGVEGLDGIFHETAHPAKFSEVLEEETGKKAAIPERIGNIFEKKKHAILMSNEYQDFKDYMLVK